MYVNYKHLCARSIPSCLGRVDGPALTETRMLRRCLAQALFCAAAKRHRVPASLCVSCAHSSTCITAGLPNLEIPVLEVVVEVLALVQLDRAVVLPIRHGRRQALRECLPMRGCNTIDDSAIALRTGACSCLARVIKNDVHRADLMLRGRR